MTHLIDKPLVKAGFQACELERIPGRSYLYSGIIGLTATNIGMISLAVTSVIS